MPADRRSQREGCAAREPPGRTVVDVDDDGSVIGSANPHPIHPGHGAHAQCSSMRSSKRPRSSGFQILATVPEAFRHPAYGSIGLHVMHKTL